MDEQLLSQPLNSSVIAEVAARFWGFEKLIGSNLVKPMYYLGLFGIAFFVLRSVVNSLDEFRYSFDLALAGIVSTLFLGVVGLVAWRFFCEVCVLTFQILQSARRDSRPASFITSRSLQRSANGRRLAHPMKLGG